MDVEELQIPIEVTEPVTSAEADGLDVKPPVEEEVKPPPTPEEAKAERAAARFAAAARKEAALAAREAGLTERQSKAEAYEKLQSQFIENPAALLEHLGITFEQLVDAQINQGAKPKGEAKPLDVASAVAAEVAKVEARYKEEARKANEARVIQEYTAEIDTYIKADVDRAELFATEGATAKDVLDVIEADWDRRDVASRKAPPMTYQQASDLIEKHLLGQAKAKLEALSKMKRLTAQPAAATPAKPVVDASVKREDAPAAKVTRTSEGRFSPVRTIKHR